MPAEHVWTRAGQGFAVNWRPVASAADRLAESISPSSCRVASDPSRPPTDPRPRTARSRWLGIPRPAVPLRGPCAAFRATGLPGGHLHSAFVTSRTRTSVGGSRGCPKTRDDAQHPFCGCGPWASLTWSTSPLSRRRRASPGRATRARCPGSRRRGTP